MKYAAIDEVILEKFYILWRDGGTNTAIRDALGYEAKEYERLLPVFNNYCRYRVKKDTAENLSDGKALSIALTPERRKEFLDYAASGLGYDVITRIMNIPLPTLFNVWFVHDEGFKAECETAIDKANAEVILALFKRAKGYDYKANSKNKTTTTTKNPVSKDGMILPDMTVESETTSEMDKHVLGSVDAQRLWLINRMPEKFSTDGAVNKVGNRGKILDALDEAISGESGEMSVEEEDMAFQEG